MLDYDFYYGHSLNTFSEYKDAYKNIFEARSMSSSFFVFMVKSIFERTGTSDEEKLTEIRAMNDAFDNSFPA
ncbi:hypothetical protein C162_21958 [Paenibacillus sp. FSL R7-269]|uniref:hypothetical protein n=1 Tax=Paenibacillus sp. FSL R7-269 TaxID=1226755 RepID=UPI0003E2BC64|nr:hypothetical protein [Paenibacillus sp. FSL R7-269]ETT45246.1 hypothetical protein C162_21958 [Paenibacillus sp. FSL R7-269]